MRGALAVILVLTACGSPSARPAGEVAIRDDVRAVPISDLHFNDYQLEQVAEHLVRRARERGIEVSSGRNRIERLLALEASLGGSSLALERVNSLAAHVMATDDGRWAKLRRRAEVEFRDGRDERAQRVLDLLKRWQMAKSDAALSHLSSNYKFFIGSAGWERKFYEFVSAQPMDVATWAWLIARYDAASVRQQYGKADAETAYRFYLESSRFGDAREARQAFSVPGIEIADAR